MTARRYQWRFKNTPLRMSYFLLFFITFYQKRGAAPIKVACSHWRSVQIHLNTY
jgi:hypothetical protein